MDNIKAMIPKRVLRSILDSINAGVVPRSGIENIAIGRTDEIKALMSDLENIADSGSSFRIIAGRYGSGKSFLLQLIRNYALNLGFVTMDADLTPERRLHSTNGQSAATYRELIKNAAVKSMPDGGALTVIITKWITSVQSEVAAETGAYIGDPLFNKSVESKIFEVMQKTETMTHGFDFANVIRAYYRGMVSGDDGLKSAAMRWLCGEFPTKTAAKPELPVQSIIDDGSWYDYIKLLSGFVRLIGYKGIILLIDECVVLYKLSNTLSRNNNYEKILTIFNDTLQGNAPGLGVFLGGTLQFLEDNRRGLYSYEALRSRLSDGRYGGEYKNFAGPVIRLPQLTHDEIYALIFRIRNLHREYHGVDVGVNDDNLLNFLQEAANKLGADALLTPRELIRDFISILNILLQNPHAVFSDLVKTNITSSPALSASPDESDAINDALDSLDTLEF